MPLYRDIDKRYTGCNLKISELLECALIGVYAVIRSNTIYQTFRGMDALERFCHQLPRETFFLFFFFNENSLPLYVKIFTNECNPKRNFLVE